VYADKCAHCHGDTGKGDGRDANRYDPAPTDLSDSKKMNPATDGELFYKISEGKKPMPVFKNKLTEDQRWQLVLLFVRSRNRRNHRPTPLPSEHVGAQHCCGPARHDCKPHKMQRDRALSKA